MMVVVVIQPQATCVLTHGSRVCVEHTQGTTCMQVMQCSSQKTSWKMYDLCKSSKT